MGKSLIQAFAVAAALVSGAFLPAEGQNIIGKVSCGTHGVRGVAVSDGVSVALTDAEGRYSLESDKRFGNVFISVPGGYDVPSDGLIPCHFARLSKPASECDTADFILLKARGTRFKLFVFSDMHLTGNAAVGDIRQLDSTFLPDIVGNIMNTKGRKYAICLGDMTTDNKWYVDKFSFPQYLNAMKSLPIPIYHIMGNHDNDMRPGYDWKSVPDPDTFASEAYRKYIGPSYYSFNIGRFHFLMLDDIIAQGPSADENRNVTYHFHYGLDSVQLKWVERDLAFVPHGTPVIVCLHVPMHVNCGFCNGSVMVCRSGTEFVTNGERPSADVAKKLSEPDTSFDELFDMLEPYRRVGILSGHRHKTDNIPYKGTIEHNVASASAVSWMLNGPESRIICEDGTPSGYQVFTIYGKEMRWIFKACGEDTADSQMRVYDMNSIPAEFGGSSSNRILVNVFDWDPEWTVKIFENGKELAVRQVFSRDPLYSLIRKPRLPDRPGSFLPTDTVHMFEAFAATPDGDVQVVVKDRFGNVYKRNVVRPSVFSWNMK